MNPSKTAVLPYPEVFIMTSEEKGTKTQVFSINPGVLSRCNGTEAIPPPPPFFLWRFQCSNWKFWILSYRTRAFHPTATAISLSNGWIFSSLHMPHKTEVTSSWPLFRRHCHGDKYEFSAWIRRSYFFFHFKCSAFLGENGKIIEMITTSLSYLRPPPQEKMI